MTKTTLLLSLQEPVDMREPSGCLTGTYTATKATEEADQDAALVALGTVTFAQGEASDVEQERRASLGYEM